MLAAPRGTEMRLFIEIREETNLGVKFIVTEIQRRIDRFKRFKIDVHFLFSPIIGDDRSTINHQTIVRH